MPITLIGDTDQLLYRFSGAKPEIISRDVTEMIPDILTFKLETNYRSAKEIIRRQRNVIRNNYSDRGGRYDSGNYKSTKPRDGADNGIPFTVSAYDTPEEEAKHVAMDIAHMIEAGRLPGEFFVGARTVAQLGYLEGELTRQDIPFLNLCGGSFFGSAHVMDVISYMKLTVNQADRESFKRVFNIASTEFVYPFGQNKGTYCYHRFLGKRFLDEVHTLSALDNPEYLYWQHRNGARDLLRFMDMLTAVAGDPVMLIDTILNFCYIDYLKASDGMVIEDEGENSKLQDFETLKSIASQFETTEEFLLHVDAMIALAEKAKDGDQNDYVIISTVHRLKGKERNVVFGIGICEGYTTTKYNNQKPAGLLPHTFSLIDPPQFGVYPPGNRSPIEDERCIFFVLISRAREEVHLSYPRHYRDASMGPSRFIEEMNDV
jgi:DNA helicase-2/ATP-dependent DNA helicase PcrA